MSDNGESFFSQSSNNRQTAFGVSANDSNIVDVSSAWSNLGYSDDTPQPEVATDHFAADRQESLGDQSADLYPVPAVIPATHMKVSGNVLPPRSSLSENAFHNVGRYGNDAPNNPVVVMPTDGSC